MRGRGGQAGSFPPSPGVAMAQNVQFSVIPVLNCQPGKFVGAVAWGPNCTLEHQCMEGQEEDRMGTQERGQVGDRI